MIAAALRVEYCNDTELQQLAAQDWPDILAIVRFDENSQSASADGVPVIHVAAPALNGAGAGGTTEIWRLSGPMSGGLLGRLRYRCNGRLLFAALSVAESEFSPAPASDGTALHVATRTAYAQLLNGIEQLGFAHPLRIWHFLPAIDTALDQGDRYWHFNSARQSAFLEASRSLRGQVPAATAAGTLAGTPLTFYCIASASPPTPLENPRQCAAWAYPAQYGPKSPTFARACIDSSGDQPTLFISGTGSIVGHQTVHAGDVAEQTRESLRNVRALVSAANAQRREARDNGEFVAERLRYKAYVRRASDQPHVQRVLQQEGGIETPILYLQANLCRRDLLVEIEASGTQSEPHTGRAAQCQGPTPLL